MPKVYIRPPTPLFPPMPIDAWERSALQEKVAPILITLSAVRKLFTATNPRSCATPKIRPTCPDQRRHPVPLPMIGR